MRFTADRQRTPSGGQIGWPERLCAALGVVICAYVLWLMLRDRVDPASVSNRSFAPPALALAVVLSTYFAWRLRGVHPVVRVFGWALAVSVLYLALGLIFILLNAGLR